MYGLPYGWASGHHASNGWFPKDYDSGMPFSFGKGVLLKYFKGKIPRLAYEWDVLDSQSQTLTLPHAMDLHKLTRI